MQREQSSSITKCNKGHTDEYVYDLYCRVDQQTINSEKDITSEKTKGKQDLAECNHGIRQENVGEVKKQSLPNFESVFGHAATNIVGCDWKSAQAYLAGDDMPAWWHRGSDVNKGKCEI